MKAFDTGQYTANYNPVSNNPFVTPQTIMSDISGIGAEIISLLPELLKLFSAQQLESMLEQGLTTLVDMIFPSGGPVGATLDSIIAALLGDNGPLSGLPSGTSVIDYIDGAVQQSLDFIFGHVKSDIAAVYAAVISALSGTGTGLVDMLNALKNIPGVNIISMLLAAIIPGLDGSKIVSGTIGQTKIENLVNDIKRVDLMFTNANMVLDPTFDNAVMWSDSIGEQTSTTVHSGTFAWALTGTG